MLNDMEVAMVTMELICHIIFIFNLLASHFRFKDLLHLRLIRQTNCDSSFEVFCWGSAVCSDQEVLSQLISGLT